MANSTTYLDIPAVTKTGVDIVHAEKEVDFSKENVAIAGTIDVLNLPKGAVPVRNGWITKKVNTDATAKIALAVVSPALTTNAAAVLGAANAVTMAALTSSKVLTADSTLRLTASVAALTDAKIVVFADYFVSDACR